MQSEKIPHRHSLTALSSLVLALLMFCISVLLFLQASNGGKTWYFDNGIAFEAKDLAFALLLLAMMLLPFLLASLLDAKFHTRSIWLAPVVSLAMPFIFPLHFQLMLWEEASYPDGKPMFSYGGEREKSFYASLGYRPYWEGNFMVSPPYDRYETTDLGSRESYRGNRFWGVRSTYGLNHKGWLTVEDADPERVYECIFQELTHLFGFYWMDSRGQAMEYWSEASLPSDQCQRIERPMIGSEIP